MDLGVPPGGISRVCFIINQKLVSWLDFLYEDFRWSDGSVSRPSSTLGWEPVSSVPAAGGFKCKRVKESKND